MNKAKLKLLSAMGIFGTIGIFVKYIPLPSATIAFARGLLGVTFLALVMLLTRKKLNIAEIKKNLPLLIISGGAIGINWVLLFESYRYTSVATATICYYLAPLFLLLASPLLGERLTAKKIKCISAALIGMVFVSGITQGPLPTFAELRGILFSVGAAILYASVMFMNKKMSPIDAYEKTIIQLGGSTIVVFIYLLFAGNLSVPTLSSIQWILLITVGVLHTGFAYALYFGSMKDLSAETVALFSYLDPVIAIFLSAFLLGEPMTFSGIIGAILILGSALYSELPSKK